MKESRLRRSGALAALLAGVLGANCTPESPPLPTPQEDGSAWMPVYLLGTELLEPPATGKERVFKPVLVSDHGLDETAAGSSAGFFVTVATGAPEALMLRLADLESGVVTDFVSLDPPITKAQRQAAAGPRAFDDRGRDMLRSGTGVFWLADSPAPAEGMEHRYAVLIPEVLLSPFTRLEMFNVRAADGTPLGAARIELVRDFFYLAIIGDSIQWGNGLLEEDKMSALITEVIERQTQKRVIRQRYAHSGARVVPAEGDSICEVDCFGEVPTASTSITVQADLIHRPELMDLILMDGCINDVGVGTIINPETTDEELTELTRKLCRDEMTTLLSKVRSKAPQTPIVVTGYFQIIGPESDLFALEQWRLAHGSSPAGEEELQLIDELTHQAILFRDTAHEGLRAAIDAVNAEAADNPGIAFADPGFGPENAVFTPDRWLWSMTADSDLFRELDLELELFPEDPIQELRLSRCLEANVIDALLGCLYASVGHPNPTGARAYAEAILDALRDLEVLAVNTIQP